MVIVIKIGGSLVAQGKLDTILSDLASVLPYYKTVLVHGGAKSVTEIAERMGKKQKFITSPSGIKSRYTDYETAEIYCMVMSGLLASRIVSFLAGQKVKAFSISGLDASAILAERKKKLIILDERNRKVAIEGGYTGKIKHVDSKIIDMLLQNSYLPVISPVAIGTDNEILNVDSDRCASAVASSLKAEQLIFLTNVDGLMHDGKLVNRITKDEAKKLLPEIGAGMDKKVMSAIEALENGVKRCVISSGMTDKPISGILKSDGGTVILNG
ncbi:MAG: [LysW]-aminoadipate/[LysW]-glutamate kinase [Conexivisphaerales archaeon]